VEDATLCQQGAPHRLLGLTAGGEGNDDRARPRPDDVERGVVARLADRQDATPQQGREIVTEAFEDDAARQGGGKGGVIRIR